MKRVGCAIGTIVGVVGLAWSVSVSVNAAGSAKDMDLSSFAEGSRELVFDVVIRTGHGARLYVLLRGGSRWRFQPGHGYTRPH